MSAKTLKDRRMFVAVAGSALLLAAAASRIANAGEDVRTPFERAACATIVQDKAQESGLQTKLFLHRQGYFGLPPAPPRRNA